MGAWIIYRQQLCDEFHTHLHMHARGDPFEVHTCVCILYYLIQTTLNWSKLETALQLWMIMCAVETRAFKWPWDDYMTWYDIIMKLNPKYGNVLYHYDVCVILVYVFMHAGTCTFMFCNGCYISMEMWSTDVKIKQTSTWVACKMHYSNIKWWVLSHLKSLAIRLFFNNVFRITSGKYQKLCICWPFVRRIHQSLVDSLHKWPIMQKTFSCHNIIMVSMEMWFAHMKIIQILTVVMWRNADVMLMDSCHGYCGSNAGSSPCSFHKIQCGAVITQSIFSQILIKDTP